MDPGGPLGAEAGIYKMVSFRINSQDRVLNLTLLLLMTPVLILVGNILPH